MKIAFMILLCVAGMSHFDGCGLDSKSSAKASESLPAIPAAPKCSSSHRFEKTDVYPMNMRADIALDSCTGQICKTWPWEVKGSSNSPWKTYEDAPLCKDLSSDTAELPKNNPSVQVSGTNHYAVTTTNSNGRKIGTNDGGNNWYDIETGIKTERNQ